MTLAPGIAESTAYTIDASIDKLEGAMRQLDIDRRTSMPEEECIERDLRRAHARLTDARERVVDVVEEEWGYRV